MSFRSRVNDILKQRVQFVEDYNEPRRRRTEVQMYRNAKKLPRSSYTRGMTFSTSDKSGERPHRAAREMWREFLLMQLSNDLQVGDKSESQRTADSKLSEFWAG